jgi:hypothetical protein
VPLLVVQEQIWLGHRVLALGNPGRELKVVELRKLDSLLGRVEPQHGVEIGRCDGAGRIAVTSIGPDQIPEDPFPHSREVYFGDTCHRVRHSCVLDDGEVVGEGHVGECRWPARLDGPFGFPHIVHGLDQRQRSLDFLRIKPVLLSPCGNPLCYGGVVRIEKEVVGSELGLVLAVHTLVAAHVVGLDQRQDGPA